MLTQILIVLKKALERLDSLVIKRINPLRIEKISYSDEQLLYCLISAADDCDKIRVHLLHSAEKLKEGNDLQKFFHHYQRSLVHLLDKLSSYKIKQSDPTVNKLYDSLSEDIGELLHYIKTRFVEFFSLDCKVPDRTQALSIEGWQVSWKHLQQLMDGQGVDDELIKAVSEPISAFLTGRTSDDVTYRWLEYMEDLWEQLSQWANNKHDDPEWELISVIMFMNLNSRKCRAYCINYVVGFIDQIYYIKSKLIRLEWLYKRCCLIQVRPETAFNSKMISLKEHVAQWIHTEIELLSKNLPIDTDKVASKKEFSTEALKIHKIISGLTVEEQGAWVRGQMEAGIILNETLGEVMEIITMTHKTPRTDTPSAGTMRRKSKDLDSRSITKIRDMLKVMDGYFKNMMEG